MVDWMFYINCFPYCISNWLLVDHCQILHHMLSLISIVYSMYSGEAEFYTFMVLISETTTPGVNLRWYLINWTPNSLFLLVSVMLFFGSFWPSLSPSAIKVSWHCWHEKIQSLSYQRGYNVCCMAGKFLYFQCCCRL
jgi:cytochrome b subunit of formate dehydrogenase